MQAWWRRARHTHACTHVLAACLRTRGQACLRPWPPSTPSAAAAATSSAAAAARLAAAARRSAQTAPRLTGRHQPGRCAAAPPPPCVCGRGGTGRGGAGQGRAAGQRGWAQHVDSSERRQGLCCLWCAAVACVAAQSAAGCVKRQPHHPAASHVPEDAPVAHLLRLLHRAKCADVHGLAGVPDHHLPVARCSLPNVPGRRGQPSWRARVVRGSRLERAEGTGM